MNPSHAMSQLMAHPDIGRAGMILFHLGLVRSFSLKGPDVEAMTVHHHADRAEAIRREMLQRPGIVAIHMELGQGRLKPSEPVMLVAVAGETRDQVIPVLQEMVERIKTEAADKEEHFR